MRKEAEDRILGLMSAISRRDFVGGSLVGSGTALLAARSPAAVALQASRYAPSGSPWTGYGGLGDYQWSNGNTEAVRDAAHGIRDDSYPDLASRPIDESFDLVVVGGGFSGLTALYEFNKGATKGETSLLLENHPMLGGEAKQNEFMVDGHHLVAPQGSNTGLVITNSYVKGSYGGGRYEAYADYWRELDMPQSYGLEALGGGAEKYELANDHFDPMFPAVEHRYPTGYFFKDRGWVHDPIRAHFANTPWPLSVQHELDDFTGNKRDLVSGLKDVDRWLDTMSYHQLLDKLGYGDQVKKYIDPYIGVANFGVAGSAISAFAAKRLTLPGTIPSDEPNRFEHAPIISFPGGNSAIYRTMLRRLLPSAIVGTDPNAPAMGGRIDFPSLDSPASPVRIRTSATVIHVVHEGDPKTSQHVIVTYVQNGQFKKVAAKAVILASGGWVNRRIVADLPERHAAAYSHFNYGPVLTANVAVRNWRFFDKLGISYARWFEGLGWNVCARRNVSTDKSKEPLTFDSPMVLTFDVPFLYPNEEPSIQGSLGRGELLATSYADFERQIRTQMNNMFGAFGFDAKRDIAAIVLNRWGHAYMAPPVGFFFGRDGNKAPLDVIREPHGRVVFAHSELQGNQNMAHAMLEGRDAGRFALAIVHGG